MTSSKQLFPLVLFVIFFLVPAPGACAENTPIPHIKPLLLFSCPHNSAHFTQGLFFHNGHLYESTGGYGKSLMVVTDPRTGKRILEKKLADDFFGEGSVVAGENLYLLSWQKGLALVLDPETLDEKGSFSYEGEGWGLSYDGKHLIRSAGSSALHFHTLDGQEIFSKKICADGRELDHINELEWLPEEELLLANIWYSPHIAVIDVLRGKVIAWLNLEDFIPKTLSDPEAVLNGIALAPDGKSLWVTGKNWPVILVFSWPPQGFLQAVPDEQCINN